MNLAGPDAATVDAGGTTGLPTFGPADAEESGVFRYEFVERIGSGLVYTPKKNTGLDPAGWETLTDTPTIIPINANWQRVIYEEPSDPADLPTCFGIVEVLIPTT